MRGRNLSFPKNTINFEFTHPVIHTATEDSLFLKPRSQNATSEAKHHSYLLILSFILLSKVTTSDKESIKAPRTSPSLDQGLPSSNFPRTTSLPSLQATTSIMSNPMDAYMNPQTSSEQLDRVCIIGSGNWGSAIATKVGLNCERLSHFENTVKMWVFEEAVEVDGESRKLTEVINAQHENVKYLPGIKLPKNIVAVPDLKEACKDATLLIFVLPHQFLPRLLPTIRENCHPSCRGVSLIKGLGTYGRLIDA